MKGSKYLRRLGGLVIAGLETLRMPRLFLSDCHEPKSLPTASPKIDDSEDLRQALFKTWFYNVEAGSSPWFAASFQGNLPYFCPAAVQSVRANI